MRRAFCILLIGAMLPMFGSCIFAPKEKPAEPGTGQGPSYKPLDTKDNLFHNLELAYNQRNFEEFTKLLDSSGVFQFFFSPNDVRDGIVKNSQWGVGQELDATQALLNPAPPPGQPRASSVVLELTFSEGDDEWQPFVPSTHPNETWYDKSVSYFLEVKVNETTYTQNKAVIAVFTVRFTEVNGDSLWQIVTWRDDLGN